MPVRRVLSLLACCLFLLCGHAYADFESEVIDLVNVERAAEGLPPLSYNARLAAAVLDPQAGRSRFRNSSLDDLRQSLRLKLPDPWHQQFASTLVALGDGARLQQTLADLEKLAEMREQPAEQAMRAAADLLTVPAKRLQQRLDAKQLVLPVVVGLPDLARLAGMHDVQQPIGTNVTGSCRSHE